MTSGSPKAGVGEQTPNGARRAPAPHPASRLRRRGCGTAPGGAGGKQRALPTVGSARCARHGACQRLLSPGAAARYTDFGRLRLGPGAPGGLGLPNSRRGWRRVGGGAPSVRRSDRSTSPQPLARVGRRVPGHLYPRIPPPPPRGIGQPCQPAASFRRFPPPQPPTPALGEA